MRSVILLSIFFLLSGSAIKAQQYYPFIAESKTWSEIQAYTVFVPPYPVYLSTNSFKLEGDTVITGKIYKKLYTCSADPSISNWELSSDYLYREESGKVFKLFFGTEQEEVMYDFNLKVGDSVCVDSIYANPYAYVTLTDSLLIDGVYHKQIHFDMPPDIWVEGLGSLNSPFNPIQYYFYYPGGYELLCVTNQSGNIYMNPSYHHCYIDTILITGQPELPQRPEELMVINNPMQTFSMIKIQGTSKTFEKYSLLNSNGVIMKTGLIKNNPFIIRRESLPAGIYFLKVYGKEQVLNKKMVIK